MKAFAVFGNPISHSLSPRIHNNAIKKLNLNAFYGRFHLTNANDLRESIFKLGLRGANITLPFKEEALKIADFKDKMALNIGSANTLLVRDSKIHAYNTDGIGFLQAIAEFKELKSALILGAGGTARALAFVLAQNGIKVSIANRSMGSLKHFAHYKTALYEDLLENLDKNSSKKNNELLSKNLNKILGTNAFDLIINTTSAGLKDENLPCDEQLLKALLSKAKYAFEVIYGKQTPFLHLAHSFKIPCKDGAEMLLWQGVFAFELFFDLYKNEIFDLDSKLFKNSKTSLNSSLKNSTHSKSSHNLNSKNSKNLKLRRLIFNAMSEALNLKV
ncbi:shikimate dehydrogenase [Campylobacter troglodytis]|nr:shikimate dehydrogenase [Campylobacter troglodytis]